MLISACGEITAESRCQTLELDFVKFQSELLAKKNKLLEEGPSVNKEYLSQIQLYSIFCKLPVMSNTVLIITVCVKIAKSTFLVKNIRTKWAELSRHYLYNCFVR